MAVSDILLLGNPLLYEKSLIVEKEEISVLLPKINLMFETVLDFKKRYGAGGQLQHPNGLMKRIICLNIEKPLAMINPELINLSDEMFEIWDDCMSSEFTGKSET